MIVLVTGTDTGVGKTWAASALARAASGGGRRVVAVKPFETGCGDAPDSEDGVLLARALGQAAPVRALVRLRSPVAVPEAAEREGVTIDYDAVLHKLRSHVEGADLALVEGAGGLLSPITWERSAIDLARDLGARVLVVAADRLGTVSHCLTALRVLEAERLDVLGLVLTTPERADASTGSNARAIARLASVRVHVAPRATAPAEAARSMQPVMSWLDLA